MNILLFSAQVAADVVSTPYLVLGVLPWLILGALAVCIGLAIKRYLRKKKQK